MGYRQPRLVNERHRAPSEGAGMGASGGAAWGDNGRAAPGAHGRAAPDMGFLGSAQRAIGMPPRGRTDTEALGHMAWSRDRAGGTRTACTARAG